MIRKIGICQQFRDFDHEYSITDILEMETNGAEAQKKARVARRIPRFKPAIHRTSNNAKYICEIEIN